MDERELERRLDAMRDTSSNDTRFEWLYIVMSLLLIGVIVYLGPDTSRDIPFLLGFTALAAVPGILVYLLYRLDCRKREQRLRSISERAVPVPCTVEDSHACDIRESNDPEWGFCPAVEFTYQRNGATNWSVYPFPDGISHQGTREEAQEGAERLADLADGTAYYDPETDQAFLHNDPQTAAVSQWSGSILQNVFMYCIAILTAILVLM